ncbi:hypothetical protein [Sphingomonas spermidinifaciens]|uniref:hypothetical protein n=1 Tax=Sphingomonas spermidinifaciens TaxID=1141889 RepID=UPI001596A47F|nr:hypothetical protein [Sphingomonas spermidinifaciens]
MLVGKALAIALVTYSVALVTGVWLLLILTTIAIWRFARKNANEIGEVTFTAADN